MKMVKSLLLGTAAGLVAVAGAQAADLPVKAKPVQYVKICSLYGAGFYYIPGTDTCLKVGGWVRYETGYGYNGSFTNEWYNNNLNNRSTNENNWRVKGVISFDAREQTEYGTLRSYATLGTSNNNIGDNPTTANYVNRWFIQWAGFTVGHATSFYDFYLIGANQYGFVSGGSDSSDGGWDVLGYTAQFGNGFSASVSAEVQRRTLIRNTGGAFGGLTVAGVIPVGAAAGATLGIPWGAPAGYAGHDVPDLIANLRVDQAWGSAQIMGALHNVSAPYYTGSADAAHPNDKLGFAVGAGVRINAPMFAAGDYFAAEVDYSKGALRYLSHTTNVGDYFRYEGSSVGFGVLSDAVYGGTVAGGNASNLELTTAWNVNAAFTHFWTPAWKSTLWGSYTDYSYNNRANAMLCAGYAAFGAAGSGTTATAGGGCNMDYTMWGLGLRTEWAATKNLSIGLEVLYANLDTASFRSIIAPPGTVALSANGTKPASLYTLSDQDIWAVRFRVNRNFYP
jgi:hypothetical protein